MINFPTYQMCDKKVIAFAAIVIFIILYFALIYFTSFDKLAGANVVQIYRITLDTMWKIFGIYVAGDWATKKYQFQSKCDISNKDS